MSWTQILLMPDKDPLVPYNVPRPFVLLHGVPMFIRILTNLPRSARTIILCHEKYQQLVYQAAGMHGIDNGSMRVVTYNGFHGTEIDLVACAMKNVEPDDTLLVSRVFNWIDWSPDHFGKYCKHTQADGVIPTRRVHGDKKHYYIHTDSDGSVIDISGALQSEEHDCDVYYFRRAQFCLDAIIEMSMGPHGGGLAMAYNHMISKGAKVIAYPVPKVYEFMTKDEITDGLIYAPFGPTDMELPMVPKES